MPEKLPPRYVGLDIAKEKLDYCLSETDEGQCAYTPEGWSQLITKLKGIKGARVICEATGGYEKRIVAELLNAGIEVCVVQPGRVRAFAQAEGLMAKTDRIDARLLRRFGEKIELRLAIPPDPVLATLRELLEHRRQLSTQLSEVKGRLELAGPTLRKLLEEQKTFLEAQLKKLDEQIDKHIGQDPTLKQKSERMQQVKGVGPVLSATLLAYVPELGQIEDNQLSALIGVAPHPKDTGTIKGSRHIRGGRRQVRTVLYMAAVSASTHNPILAKFYQRLRAKGKPSKVCFVAIMRKLVCLINKLIQNPNFALA